MATHAAGKRQNSGPTALAALLLVASVACTPAAPTASGTNVTESLPTGSAEAPAAHPPGSPLPAIELTTEPAAVDLAQRVLQGGSDARPALEEAIASAGLGIIDNEGGHLLAPDEPAQGLSFRAYEVDAVIRLEAMRFGHPATGLAEIVAAPLAELDGEPVASMLLEDIRAAAAAGESPTRRFWAHFLIELGRQQENGYDLLGAISAQDVSFDAAQTAFILRRWQGDLLRVEGPAVVSLAGYEPLPHSPATARDAVGGVAAVSTECNFDDIDYNDPRAGDRMFDRISQHLRTPAAKWRGAAGIIQAYIELMMGAWPEFTVESSLAGPDPFERTKTTDRGDVQRLTSTVLWELRDEEHIVECMEAAIDYMTGSKGTSLARSGTVPGAEMVFSVRADEDRIGLLDSVRRYVHFAERTADDDGSATVLVAGRAQESNLPDSAGRVIVEQEILIRVTVRGGDLWRGVMESVDPRLLESGARSISPELIRDQEYTFGSLFNFKLADWVSYKLRIGLIGILPASKLGGDGEFTAGGIAEMPLTVGDDGRVTGSGPMETRVSASYNLGDIVCEGHGETTLKIDVEGTAAGERLHLKTTWSGPPLSGNVTCEGFSQPLTAAPWGGDMGALTSGFEMRLADGESVTHTVPNPLWDLTVVVTVVRDE